MSSILFAKLNDAPVIAPLNTAAMPDAGAYARQMRLRSLTDPYSLGYTEHEIQVLNDAESIITRRLTNHLNPNKSTWLHRTLSQ